MTNERDTFAEWAKNERTVSLMKVAEAYRARMKRLRDALRHIANAGEIHDPHWAGRFAREALDSQPDEPETPK